MARRSISRIITSLAEADPDRIVALDDTTTLTAQQLDRDSNRLARAYLARGVGQDSMVTIALPNTVEMIVACAAVWKCGATPQPVSLDLTADERADLQELVRPALVLGIASAYAGTPSIPAGGRRIPAYPAPASLTHGPGPGRHPRHPARRAAPRSSSRPLLRSSTPTSPSRRSSRATRSSSSPARSPTPRPSLTPSAA